MEKPITIVREEFIKSLAELINKSGLRAFIIRPILEDFLREVSRAEMEQLRSDKEKYNDEISSNSNIEGTNKT